MVILVLLMQHNYTRVNGTQYLNVFEWKHLFRSSLVCEITHNIQYLLIFFTQFWFTNNHINRKQGLATVAMRNAVELHPFWLLNRDNEAVTLKALSSNGDAKQCPCMTLFWLISHYLLMYSCLFLHGSAACLWWEDIPSSFMRRHKQSALHFSE